MGVTHRQTVLESFEEFREELDEHNDRRERLVKVLQQSTRFNIQ